MSERKLKPCPFCGGAPETITFGECYQGMVACQNCSAKIGRMNLADAIKAWEKRVDILADKKPDRKAVKADG